MRFSMVSVELVDVEVQVTKEGDEYDVKLSWPDGYRPSKKEAEQTLQEAMTEYDHRILRM
jgi:hypothetical protein